MLTNYITPIFLSIILIQTLSFSGLIILRQIIKINERNSFFIASTAILFSIILILILGIITPSNHVISVGKWFGEKYHEYKLIFIIDKISLTYSLFSLILASIIAVFSKRYLHNENGFHRFYIIMLLFICGVTLVCFAGTLEIIIIGWEIIGLSSIILISFFNYRNEPVKNSFWVFINYRICDIGLFIAVLLIHNYSHNSNFLALETASWMGISAHNLPGFIGFFILFAVIGKSALFPLSGWLPRAMEGPTPSSAIFYGAISIHLGAILLLRCADLIAANTILAIAIFIIGSITAIMGRIIGNAINDIKGSLAYGSITQLGLIICEIALGWHNLALIHIIGHSGFRTLQILRAPNLLHDRHHLEEMLGHHIGLPVKQKNKKNSKLDYIYYHFLLERGFIDNFLKDFLIEKTLNLFRLIDKLEQKFIHKISNIKYLSCKKNIHEISNIILLNILIIIFTILICYNFLSPQINIDYILPYIILFPIIGLFPFQSWYIKFFTNFSLKSVSLLILMQAIIILFSHNYLQIEYFRIIHWFLAVSALISSFLAIIQNNIRRLLSYLISSQIAFLAFASFSNSSTIMLGSNYLFLAILSSCIFVILIHSLEIRQGKLAINRPCGNYNSYPKLATFLLLFGLTASGFPLSVSYIAEDLIFAGSFAQETVIDIIWICSIALNNIIIIKIFLYLCQGTDKYEKNLDLKKPEFIIYVIIIMIMFSLIFHS
jgi:NADH-quinone oxidoreductase subunit L